MPTWKPKMKVFVVDRVGGGNFEVGGPPVSVWMGMGKRPDEVFKAFVAWARANDPALVQRGIAYGTREASEEESEQFRVRFLDAPPMNKETNAK